MAQKNFRFFLWCLNLAKHLVKIHKYSECLKSELVWISDSTILSCFQTVWISDSVWNTNENVQILDTFFCLKSELYKIKMGQNSGFWTEKSVWNPNVSVKILDTFYLHTSDSLLPSTYSVKLNLGVSKQNQKTLFQAIYKPISALSEIQTVGFQTFTVLMDFYKVLC